ncbi:hypothetical protein GF366_01465, partial [Candidatus Peregrinibacteria bacterium]|nr:hypothetical protein [Candidatus Peregrinibacteria bacterium]
MAEKNALNEIKAKRLAIPVMMNILSRKKPSHCIDYKLEQEIAKEILRIIAEGRETVKRLCVAQYITNLALLYGLLSKPIDIERFREIIGAYADSSDFQKFIERDKWVDEIISVSRMRAENCLDAKSSLIS